MSLQSLITQKNQLEKELVEIEKEIFELETSYLEDTQQNGNILKGWDGYFQNMAQQRGNARQMKIKNQDRVFSQSSLSAPKGEGDDEPVMNSTGTRKDVHKSRREKRGADSKLPDRAKLGRRKRNEGDEDDDDEED
ncbi:hypothetical protein GUITHDRAFT_135433 [Guillardia theta CCMP2712]|uniref:Chromatin modification-related protein MEAF6 n=1 Tax=Guillardia theta (strain CCMP2712) TaxID=905079 RepID=L1JNY1_GUITC|nr:hypothetical protein GUITHDRAFT_135433 [Guillardia theta CCMP2712]EKX50271.1 hypothetical protein GUITHDRAFT_135433 [Guillardia theta CCMP2712]|eukprot:XP_005837251.1 hypothetical protein GUITHDRAFT_135433 [Guillardia theta CCMP2712]